ncbi:MAG: ribonuclease R [Phycisphaerales bacterium]|nr:ribonuclease R [Phycisphaerales bacterium]MBT7171993.1 ribonuclease R [Phycisphaerales bacterium]
MADAYAQEILQFLAEKKNMKLKPRQLARQMGIGEAEYGTFREAIKQLRDEGRVVMGASDAMTLPDLGRWVVGYYRANPRGFGFIIPDVPNSHGDLFIPRHASGGALSGDTVRAKVISEGKRDGQRRYRGEIVDVLERARNRFVGELQTAGGAFFIEPEGKKFQKPIVLRDVSTAAGPKLGTKVVVEITNYGEDRPDSMPAGVVVDTLGEPGVLDVEIDAVIAANGLRDAWEDDVLECARQAVANYDPDNLDHERDRLEGRTIITIDPDDARDYDDAIELVRGKDGTWELGVHIADVAHFVQSGTPLDREAKARSTSTYFPRRVVPMLPEILSNGVCSLQEGQPRLVKSAYITYDKDGKVLSTRFAESIITSAKRLTYGQAQDILEGKTDGFEQDVIDLVSDMSTLAKAIEERRRRKGMIHLDLPEIELILDEDGKVVGAEPEDTSYTHTIIEMFMVEANEAVARVLAGANRRFLRRIHPDPSEVENGGVSRFVEAMGYKVPAEMSHRDIQKLLEAVKGKPEAYAVHLAVLKTFQQAEYSPTNVGHFALASECYCHFTSPIRRYPDLTVHRLLSLYVRGKLDAEPITDMAEMISQGRDCSAAERRAATAEDEVRTVLIMQYLQTLGQVEFEGIITGVTNFGLFVQWPEFLIDGLVRLEDLGDDWWQVVPELGMVRGDVTGKSYRIGDTLEVVVANVDVARRQINLVPTATLEGRFRQDGEKKSKPRARYSDKKKANKGRGKKSNTRPRRVKRRRK